MKKHAASEDEELQPVNKIIHVAHVENAIDDAEKTYDSVTDEIIQNSLAEKDNSAIKSPPPRVLQKRKASEDEELQPVNKKIHVAHVENAIDDAEKTYGSVTDEIIQNSLAEKDNSAIKSPPPRVLQKRKDSLQEASDSSTPSPSVLDTSVNTNYQDTQFTTVTDSSTSSSDSSAVLNTSADGISLKIEKRTNMADSLTSSINSSNATNKQSEMANAIESDVLIHNYNIVPALLNIKITRNIAANSDDRIIQLIPQPKCSNLQENDCGSKPTFMLDCRGYEVDETFDDEDDSCKNWPFFYNFTIEEAIRILSHDDIFEGAVLSSIPEHEITSSDIHTVTNRLPISSKNIHSHVTQENDIAAECDCNGAEQFEMGSHFTIPRIEREDSSSHRTSSVISADNETVVSQQNFKFKTPMLPPAKRPPTRLKSCTSDTSSRSRSPGVSELSFSTHDNEDAISLYAGTIKGSDVGDYLPSTENLKESEDNPLHIEDTSSGNNVQCRPNTLIELPKQSVTLPQGNIIKWIASDEEAIKSNPKKLPPAVFNQLCYYYFARDRCKRAHKCIRRHMLPVAAAEQIKNLSQEELLRAYYFTKDKYKLYTQTIHYFIKTFEERKCMSNVLSMVNDIMNITMFDRTPLINEIIKALQAMNQSFCSAVEMIVAQQAPNIVLSDILLYIICVQHKDELTKNWNLVQKLIQYRSCHHIDHHLLEDIITECCCNKNKDLCKNVMKDIISQNLVELQIVSVNKINDFLSLLRSLELEDEELVLIDVMKQYNIIMQNTGLTSTPPLTSAENRLTTRNYLNYRDVSTEQLLQNERVISNEYNKNMRNSCSVDENLQQFSDCQKSNDTAVHKDAQTLTTSNTQYMWSKHNDGNISNFKTDSRDYYDTTWTKNVKLPNSSSHALQFDMDEYQRKHISRELNLVSQNIEIESSTASDNYIKSNFCQDFSLTRHGIFGTDREKSYQINSPDQLDFAKNFNVVSDRSSLISHDSSSNSITNRDVTNNMGMQYIQCCKQKIYQPVRDGLHTDQNTLAQSQQLHKLLQRQGADGTTKQEGGQPVRFDRKLLDLDYRDDEDEDHVNPSPKPPPSATNNAAMETVGSLSSNPEVLRQLQTLQQTMSQSQHAHLEKLRKLQEMNQQEVEFDKHLIQTVPNLSFASESDLKPPATNNSPAVLQNYYLPGVQGMTIPPPGYKQTLQGYEIPSQQEEITLDSEIQFLGGNDSGDLEVINMDHTDSRSQSPHDERYSSRDRRSRSRDRSRDKVRDRDTDRERQSRRSRRNRRRREKKKDRKKEKESLSSNPEVLRQLQTLQQTMSQSQHADLEKLRKLQEMKQQEEEFDKHLARTVPNLRFASESDLKPPATNNSPAVLQKYYLLGVQDMTIPPTGYKQTLQGYEIPSQQEEITLDSEIQFLGGNDSGDLEVINVDHTDSLNQSPHDERYSSRDRRSRSRDRPRDRVRDRDTDREKQSRRSRRDRRRHSRSRERDRKRDHKKKKDRKKEKESRKYKLPPVKKENLSVCSTTLWVSNLSKLVHQEELSDTFGEFGDVVSIDLIPSRGCAFIVMHRRQDATRCLQKLKNHKMHGKAITIAWSPGKGVKGKDLEDYWEVDLGVSYIPWSKVKPDIDLEMLEDGGMIDEDTMPAWLKAKINQRTSKLLPPPQPPLMPNEITDPAMAAAASTATIDTSQPMPLPGGGLVQSPTLSLLIVSPLQLNNQLLEAVGMNLPPGMMLNVPIGMPPPNMPPGAMMANQLLGLGPRPGMGPGPVMGPGPLGPGPRPGPGFWAPYV